MLATLPRERDGPRLEFAREEKIDYLRAQEVKARALRQLAEGRTHFERSKLEMQELRIEAAKSRRRGARLHHMAEATRQKAEIARRYGRSSNRLLTESRQWELEASRTLRNVLRLSEEASRKERETRSLEDELRLLIAQVADKSRITQTLRPRRLRRT